MAAPTFSDSHLDWQESKGRHTDVHHFHASQGLLPETPPDVALNQAMQRGDFDAAWAQQLSDEILQTMARGDKDAAETQRFLADLAARRPPHLTAADQEPSGAKVPRTNPTTYERVCQPFVPSYTEWLQIAEKQVW